METREFSNKFSRYRKRLLSYASGRVVEFGIGTGANLPYYRYDVEELVGIDWSDKMIMKAFENIDACKQKEKEQNSENPRNKVKLTTQAQSLKIIRGDCMNLKTFKDGEFDCVVSTFVLNSCFDRD